ncbi:MBL fold metallo-hydrolase [Myxococcota bacterium]|nr:MBL fold metallo-hydrolase [Myxococcota bacterium]
MKTTEKTEWETAVETAEKTKWETAEKTEWETAEKTDAIDSVYTKGLDFSHCHEPPERIRLFRSPSVFSAVCLLPFFSVVCFLFFFFACAGPGRRTDHFDGRRFHNYEGEGRHTGTAKVFKWLFTRERRPWPDQILSTYGPKPPATVANGRLRVTFVGHSTVLLQADGRNILFDPVWSERVSPVSFAGPARVRPPGLRFEDLPPVHVVGVSHDHYDHMDLATLSRLKKMHNPLFVVPLGCKKRLTDEGIRRVIELDWWKKTDAGGLPVHVVPARHFSGRSLTDRDSTLWGGFVVQTRGGPVLYAGDTGHGRHFRQIRARFGPMRLSVLPIGAYLPRWFMRPVHLDPADAVQAHLDLHSRRSMAMHFGTFPLADEGRLDPPHDLATALRARALAPSAFFVPEEGFGTDVP